MKEITNDGLNKLGLTFQEERIKSCEVNRCTVTCLTLPDSIVAFFPFVCNIADAYLDIFCCCMGPLEFFRHYSFVLRAPVLGCHRTAVWSLFLLHTLPYTWSILTMRPIRHCELALLKSGREGSILVQLCYAFCNNVLCILLLIVSGQYTSEETMVMP